MGAADVVVVVVVVVAVAVAVGGRLPPAEDAGAVAVAREGAGAVKPPRKMWGPTSLRETKRKFFMRRVGAPAPPISMFVPQVAAPIFPRRARKPRCAHR